MKVIKALCYISIVLSFCASGLLIIWGLLILTSNDSLGFIWIAAGAASFLVATTSAYPIFALGLAEERISKLEQKVNELQKNLKEYNRAIYQTTDTNKSHSWAASTKNSTSDTKKDIGKLPTYEEAVDFVNQKYGTSILPQDALDTIKEKVDKIDEGGFSAIVFKRKVLEAASKQELENVFVMHKTTCD